MKSVLKSLLFGIGLLMSSQCAHATAQKGNIIYIDNEEWGLFDEPIGADSTLFYQMIVALPEKRGRSTANWYGYTSFWSIRDSMLLLDSICTEEIDETTHKFIYSSIPRKDTEKVFKAYIKDSTITATWFTGEIRIVNGKCIHYVHMGFASTFEEESILTFKQGHLTARKDYHNRVTGELNFDDYANYFGRKEALNKVLRETLGEYCDQGKPETLSITVKNIQVDSLGHLTDCTVLVSKWIRKKRDWQEERDIAEQVRQAFMAAGPWKVLYVYGKYMPYDMEEAYYLIYLRKPKKKFHHHPRLIETNPPRLLTY